MLTKDDLLSLRAKQGKLVKVILSRPLYLVGENEQFRLLENYSQIQRIPTIREVVGYLTRYTLSDSGLFRWLKINPFGKEGVMINKDGERAGDIQIKLGDIARLEVITSLESYRK